MSKTLLNKYVDRSVKFIFISIDDKVDDWRKASIKDKIEGYDYSYLFQNYTKHSIYKRLNLTTIPRYIVFDKNGNLVDVNAPRPGDPELIPLLDKLLSNK